MQKINFDKINPFDKLGAGKIHFIGIGGIGLSAIAKLMLARGKIVSGSDANDSEILDDLRKSGAKITIVQKAENLADDVELVIYTLAIPTANPERVKAEKLKIPMLAYPEALGMLFNDKFGIAVCGTHGKSTTTSMVGLIFAEGGLDPSVVIGSKVLEFHGNLRIGKGKHFVIEACEYERAFLEYFPKIIVLNNIELDHTDYYKEIKDYTSAFIEFINHLPSDGLLIYNGDDGKIPNYKTHPSAGGPNKLQNPNSKFQTKFSALSFGFDKNNDVRGYDIETIAGKTKFKVDFQGKNLGEFELKLPGKFNIYNALAATAVGLRLGIDVGKIKKSLADFGGIWRRFEIKGEYKPAAASAKLWRGKGATIISDYAHHPTAVKVTIEAARQFYPGKRIFAIFQPHQHNRTKMLYNDFLKSFDLADALILVEIFDVAGREEKKDRNVSSQGLAEDIKKRNKKISSNDSGGVYLRPNNIFYAKNLDETRRLIDDKIKPGDIVLIMGAGDIYKVADELVKE